MAPRPATTTSYVCSVIVGWRGGGSDLDQRFDDGPVAIEGGEGEWGLRQRQAVGNEAREVDEPGPRECDGAGIDVLHAPHELDGHSLTARLASGEGGVIVRGDTDEHDGASGADDAHGVLGCLGRAGALDHDVCTLAVGGVEHSAHVVGG